MKAVADKVKAIGNAPTPLLPNISTVLEPLHELLRKGHQDQAVKAAKQCLQSEDLLVHYDDKKTPLLGL